ncbi:MAG TPA: hypothetical protein VHO72_02365 [Bacteroidales bacterium]|nr:hypothetical protein [Bacteroidales bacterium]
MSCSPPYCLLYRQEAITEKEMGYLPVQDLINNILAGPSSI